MSNTTKVIIALVLVAVVAGGAILMTRGNATNNGKSSSDTGNTSAAVTVTYDENGFSPAEVTVTSGDSVKFVNNSDKEIQPSSNPHPVHTDNPELNVGDIEAGKSKTVTLTTKGTWGYHNHYSTDKHGTIIVE